MASGDSVALAGLTKKDETARAAVRVFEVDHQAVTNVIDVFDGRVEVARAEAYPTAVQGCVGTAGDAASTPRSRQAISPARTGSSRQPDTNDDATSVPPLPEAR